jgi:regulatory protein
MDASLSYLARFASTRRNLARYLRTKFVAPEDGDLDALIARCIERLVELQLLDDARFAEDRARGLRAQGKSARAIRERLSRKGVEAALVEGTLRAEDEGAELVSAIRHAKRRRLGPFRTKDKDEARELAAFARAGFSYGVARRVMSLELDDAERAISAR